MQDDLGQDDGLPRALRALIVAGDLACAHDDPRALAETARRLAARLGAYAPALDEIARLATDDAFAACARWLRLSARLRAGAWRDGAAEPPERTPLGAAWTGAAVGAAG